MKLASLRHPLGSSETSEKLRDGHLVVVSRDGMRAVSAESIAASLQFALDRWDICAPKLEQLYQQLNADSSSGQALPMDALLAPLPRAYEWLDGSAYLSHVELVRKARGAEPPETLRTDPLIYQGGSGMMLGARDPLLLQDPGWGLDFEGEICVVLADVPCGTSVQNAAPLVRLLMLANDVSLRNLIAPELLKGFGFVQSKPATAFSPFAVTPDELGPAWREGRVHLDLLVRLNGELVGRVAAGEEMFFSFFDLIAHLATTRSYTAGTILGGGTVSNRDPARGAACLAELRMREVLKQGFAVTPFLKLGDQLQIEMFDAAGQNVFGTIHQAVVGAK